MVDERQTAIGSALAVAAGRLKNSEAKSKVVVLLTDGNNNAGDVDPVTAAKAAAALGVKIYAVGAGSPEGGIFPEEGIFGRRLVRRPGQELDEATLRRVAETGGGRYFRATDMDSLKKIYKEIDALEKTEVQVVTFSDYQDRYFPFLLAAFFVFAIEMLLSQTIWRRLP
jgi:Ca-activated chloride channel family protein